MNYNILLNPLLVSISFYSAHISSGNISEYYFGRISWNLPWHTLARRFIHLIANLKNKFEWGRDDVNKLAPPILAPTNTCICLLGKKTLYFHTGSVRLWQLFQASLMFLSTAWAVCSSLACSEQGILKGEVSLYHWPPVQLVWNQLYDNWQLLFLFSKQTNPNRSNRRSMVQWYLPL